MSTDYAHADIGIVSALPIELSAFLDRCQRPHRYKSGGFVFRGGRYDGIRVAFVEAGMGFVRARNATAALIESHTPKWVLSCGFSGALLPDMRIGHIVMANSIVDQHGQELKLTLNAESNPSGGLYVGRILTSDEMIRSVSEKQQLAEQHGAIAVDMESLAVAQIARDKGSRFMAIRVISDDMSADLPPEVLSVVGATGAVRIGAALGSLLKRPESAKEMWHLRSNAKIASESLATFLDGVAHQLYDTK
ncbi:MAG: phosphorylase family protein [Planctomycetota bacterium]|jgi:adenosylhomocysteine nucleosidase